VTTLPCTNDRCGVVLFVAERAEHEARLDGACSACGAPGDTDGVLEWCVRVTHPRQTDPLLLPQPTAGAAATTAAQINGDSTEARAEILSRPWVGWT
jgi:hypothetical protein